MKPVILLLVGAATIGAAPTRPARHAAPAPRYEAGGFEPSWNLVIERGRLTYDSGIADVPVLRLPLPRRQAVRNGYRYVTRGFTVDVRHVPCESYSGLNYPDTVRVTGVTEPGCGGVAIAPATLRNTSWHVVSINGVPIGDGEADISFQGDGRLTGRFGCSDLSVSYREQRPLVRLGAVRVTSRDFCRRMGRTWNAGRPSS